MRWFRILRGALLPALVLMTFMPRQSLGNGNLHKVKHIIIVMQENHSFDNYFGALAYAPGSPYHGGPCKDNDHACVDGLDCTRDLAGNLSCFNTNPDDDSTPVSAFHEPNYCVKPDLNHEWLGSHMEA